MSLFNRKKQNTNQDAQNIQKNVIPKSSYHFVEQYTLTDPHKLMTKYSLFGLCKNIPVAYETETSSGWLPSIEIPNEYPFNAYISQLSSVTSEEIKDPRTRTISIINVAPNKKVYVLPDIKTPKNPVICIKFDDENAEKAWPLYMTPDIRHAIVEQLKIHTRR